MTQLRPLPFTFSAVFGLAYVACGGTLGLDDRPCPCGTGYVCCEATNRCLAESAAQSCPASGPGGGSHADAGSSSAGGAVTGAGSVAGRGGAETNGGKGSEALGGAASGAGGELTGGAGESSSGDAGTAGQGGGVTSGWKPIALAPIEGRRYHEAVWAGDTQGHGKLVIYGGEHVQSGEALGTGARYDPELDQWLPMKSGTPRRFFGSAWTGERVLFWGGEGTTAALPGDIYDPAQDTWESMAACPYADLETSHPLLQWTSKYLLVWNSGHGARYDLAAKTWSRMADSGGPFGDGVVPVWTGSRWIIWGGFDGRLAPGTFTDHGAAYDPDADEWTPLPITEQTPSPRNNYLAAWSGKELLIWSGFDGFGKRLDGSVYGYDPALQVWRRIDALGIGGALNYGVSASLELHSMFVWGGLADQGEPTPPGAIFDWQRETWRAMPSAGAPSARVYHSTVWTGSELIVWGGYDGDDSGYLNDGAAFIP